MNSVKYLAMLAGKSICLSSCEGIKCFECFILIFSLCFLKSSFETIQSLPITS